MRIESSGDPYKNLSDALYRILDKKDLCIETYVLHIRTGVLGDDHVICEPCFDTGDITWCFDNDWYEGGEIEFLGYCALSDLEIPDNVDAEPAQVTDEELVKPRWNYSEYPGIYYYFCGKCGGGIDEGQEYCPYCKTKQNWITGVPKCINPIRL